MVSPAWTDAVRDELHEDLGFGLGLGGVALALEQLFHPQADQCRFECTDATVRAKLTKVRITACRPGLDTDDDGFVYLLFADETPGAGQGRIRFYRGAARDGSADNELVASAAGDDDSDLTITPEAGYTLAGALHMAALGAGENAHEADAHVTVPPAQRLKQLFDGDNAYDQQIKELAVATIRAMRSRFTQARQDAQAFAARVFDIEVVPTLIGRTGDSLIDLGITTAQGAVSHNPVGKLRDFEQAQADNAGGSGTVKAGAAAFSGAITFPGWQGTASGLSYGQLALPGNYTAVCTKKLGTSGPNAAPQFTWRRALSDRRRRPDEGRTDAEPFGRVLWIGALWRAPEWGFSALTINYKASVTDGGDGLLSTTAGDWSVTNLTSENSSNGVFYPRYDGTNLKFYKTTAGRAAQDPSDVVAEAAVASGAVNTTFQATGASGLTINGKTGAGTAGALVTGSTGTVDFQVPALGSYFTLTIEETTEASEWVKRLRDGGVGGASWYPNTGAAPNLIDGWIKRGLPLINAGVQGAHY